jgi:hypothetical protein
MEMRSSVVIGGEVLRESATDNAVGVVLSLFSIESVSTRELLMLDWSILDRSESKLSICE